MRELTIQVPDELFSSFRKLLQNVRGVQVTKTRKLPAAAPPLTAEQQEFVDELKQSLREAAAYERGDLKLPTWQEMRAQQRAANQQPAA